MASIFSILFLSCDLFLIQEKENVLDFSFMDQIIKEISASSLSEE